MSIRKFSGLVIGIFMINLLGCATSTKKTEETGLKKFEKLPEAVREKIIAPKKTEQKKTVISVPRHIASGKEIQTALKNAGYYTGSIDGKIGPKTDSAIRAFQKDNSLKADGVVGKKTWNLLNKYLFLQEKFGTKKGEAPIIQPAVSAENIEPSITAPVPEDVTNQMEEVPADEQKPSMAETAPVTGKRGITPLAVIIIAILGVIFGIVIYRRRKTSL